MASQPSFFTATLQRPVLLICTATTPTQRAEVDQLLEKLRAVLTPTVQIMRVSETTHPEVVRSFGFTSVPSFVLLLRGLELWRYSGSVDNPELLAQLAEQMQQPSFSL
ncbi:hypothetical protein GCM10028807_04320 [Spirosoma daeguense]